MSEYKQIAKKFCEKIGFTLLFVNEYKIGVEKPDTREMFTMTWKDMAERLEEVQEKEKGEYLDLLEDLIAHDEEKEQENA